MMARRKVILLGYLGVGLAAAALVAIGTPAPRHAARPGPTAGLAVASPVRPWGLGSIFAVGGGLAWLIGRVQQGERLGDPWRPVPGRWHRIREDLRWTARLLGTVGAVVVAGIPWMMAEFDARHSPGLDQGWSVAAGGIFFVLTGALLAAYWGRRWARLPPHFLRPARVDPGKLAGKLPQTAGLWDHDLDGH